MSEVAFAVWITGLPSSGKSTITTALVEALQSRGVDVAVLESDVLRRVLTPHPTYDNVERDTFYSAMVYIGLLLTQHGVPVIFDATGNRRMYRERARQMLPRFVEVVVECPSALCAARDVKGLYAAAAAGRTSTMPGVQSIYEPPVQPDAVVSGHAAAPAAAAQTIIDLLKARQWLVAKAPNHGER